MSIYIVFGIIALILLLAGYAFISLSLEKRRVHRQRLVGALRLRERNFKEMLAGLPPHFLPAELSILVHRALIDTCEQLARLEPRDPNHQANATHFTAQLGSIKVGGEKQRVRLENPSQIKELRQHLEELFRFVGQQEIRKHITPLQAASYNDQIKRLALQVSVDGNIAQARLAQQQAKWRLAIHFLTLAQKQLTAENASHGYDKQIAQLQAAITKLQEKLTDQPDMPAPVSEGAAEAGASKEWDEFAEENWKKKQLYD